jgi:hypothetical protein
MCLWFSRVPLIYRPKGRPARRARSRFGHGSVPKELAPAFPLGIARIEDLPPLGSVAVRVRVALGDDPLEIMRTGRLEELLALRVVGEGSEDRAGTVGYEDGQPTLAGGER